MTDSARQSSRPGYLLALSSVVGIPLLLNDLVMTAAGGHGRSAADGLVARWLRGFLLALFALAVYQGIATAFIMHDLVWALTASFVLGTLGFSCLLAVVACRECPFGMMSIEGVQITALAAAGISICILPMASAVVLFALMPGSGTLLFQIAVAYLAVCGLCSLVYSKLLMQLEVVKHG